MASKAAPLPDLTSPYQSDGDARSISRSYNARESIPMRRRIKELQIYARDRWKTALIPDTAEGSRLTTIILHHHAHFIEGAELADNFLATRTKLGEPERVATITAAFRTKRLYKADELAALIGLTMAKRTQLGLTTIGAIDCSLAERKEQARLRRNASRRTKRRLVNQPKASDRKASRRLAAIYAAVPDDEWVSTKALAERLSGAKEFANVRSASMRKVVHRLIEADGGQLLRAETRTESGGRFEATFIARARQGDSLPSPKMPPRSPSSLPPPQRPPAPASERPREPECPDTYRSWFMAKLAGFTTETAADLAQWFYEPAAKQLRSRCGVTDLEDEFMRLARARWIELGRPKHSRPETEGQG